MSRASSQWTIGMSPPRTFTAIMPATVHDLEEAELCYAPPYGGELDDEQSGQWFFER